jgi:hypothetical protein
LTIIIHAAVIISTILTEKLTTQFPLCTTNLGLNATESRADKSPVIWSQPAYDKSLMHPINQETEVRGCGQCDSSFITTTGKDNCSGSSRALPLVLLAKICYGKAGAYELEEARKYKVVSDQALHLCLTF